MTDVDELPIGPPPREASGSLEPLIAAYAIARTRREQADAETKDLKATEAAAEVALFDAMERQGLHAVKSKDFGHFTLNDLAWADVQDKDRARQWAENEMPELLLLNASQLAVIVRQAARGEREMPPGVAAKFSRRINWRRS